MEKRSTKVSTVEPPNLDTCVLSPMGVNVTAVNMAVSTPTAPQSNYLTSPMEISQSSSIV